MKEDGFPVQKKTDSPFVPKAAGTHSRRFTSCSVRFIRDAVTALSAPPMRPAFRPTVHSKYSFQLPAVPPPAYTQNASPFASRRVPGMNNCRQYNRTH